MRPANDRHIDYRRLVRTGYDRCASEYMQSRGRDPADLDLLLPRITEPSTVLDLGCGSGVPVARALTERHRVTGVDFSARQLELARASVPAGVFLRADISTVAFRDAAFDAVVAFYVVFHLPRADQVRLFAAIGRWLKPGGYLLASLSRLDEPPYTRTTSTASRCSGRTSRWTSTSSFCAARASGSSTPDG